MKKHLHAATRVAILVAAGAFITLPAWAEKPDWAGHERGGGNHRQDRERAQYEDRQQPRQGAERYRDDRRDEGRREREHYGERDHYQRQPMVELRFSDGDRRFIHDYYGAQWQSGRCPPGLAKKHNGCLPPGQARQWRMGYALPADLRRYPLPPEVLIRLPIPPAGHEFVRVASDILLIAVGTGMVVDAIQDLGR